jgi:adenylate cyclase
MFRDIVGYTALTQRDEKLPLCMPTTRDNLIRPILFRFNGSEVKTMGDSFLVGFPSTLEAVECAVELQKAFHEHNAGPLNEKVQVRIGIHVGDVFHRGGTSTVMQQTSLNG